MCPLRSFFLSCLDSYVLRDEYLQVRSFLLAAMIVLGHGMMPWVRSLYHVILQNCQHIFGAVFRVNIQVDGLG